MKLTQGNYSLKLVKSLFSGLWQRVAYMHDEDIDELVEEHTVEGKTVHGRPFVAKSGYRVRFGLDHLSKDNSKHDVS
jgi:hypothetical protein